MSSFFTGASFWLASPFSASRTLWVSTTLRESRGAGIGEGENMG